MKSKYFFRYKLIIEKIQRSKKAFYEDIESYLRIAFELSGDKFNYSLRTFQRDKKEIYTLFGIRIVNDRTENRYYIDEKDLSEAAGKMMDAFTISNALRIHDDLSNVISFEKQNTGAHGIFYELRDTIKSKNRVKLFYHKYDKENYDEYILEPLALKEFGQRWYLVASDEGGKRPRTFALDRIISLETLKAKFTNEDFNLNSFFSDYFGIMTDSRAKFSELVLLFENHQGKYIKSMPLHHSQEILSDDEEGLKIRLKLHITFDFKQKLLSFGSLVKVISPKFLIKEMKEEFMKAVQLYK